MFSIGGLGLRCRAAIERCKRSLLVFMEFCRAFLRGLMHGIGFWGTSCCMGFLRGGGGL